MRFLCARIKMGLSHQWLENHRCGSIFLPFLSRNIHFFYSLSIKRRTLINLFWKKVHFQDLLLNCQNQAVCLSGNKWRPVLPAWILWWSLFMLYPIASRILWAVTFAFPRYKYRLNSISCFTEAKDLSACILRFTLSWIPYGLVMRSKSSALFCFMVFETYSVLLRCSIDVFYNLCKQFCLIFGNGLFPDKCISVSSWLNFCAVNKYMSSRNSS